MSETTVSWWAIFDHGPPRLLTEYADKKQDSISAEGYNQRTRRVSEPSIPPQCGQDHDDFSFRDQNSSQLQIKQKRTNLKEYSKDKKEQ